MIACLLACLFSSLVGWLVVMVVVLVVVVVVARIQRPGLRGRAADRSQDALLASSKHPLENMSMVVVGKHYTFLLIVA